jgi:NIPSNAP
MNRVVEFRTFRLHPDSQSAFHQLMREQYLPLMHRRQADVIAFGPSVGDLLGYYLVRAYGSVDAMEREQEAFYGSREWNAGLRQRLARLIDDCVPVVLAMPERAIAALRQPELNETTPRGAAPVPSTMVAAR